MEEEEEEEEAESEEVSSGALASDDVVIEAVEGGDSEEESEESGVGSEEAESTEGAELSEEGADSDNDNGLQLFATLLTLKLLKDCGALHHRPHHQWLAHSRRLIDSTLEELQPPGRACRPLEADRVGPLSATAARELRRRLGVKGRLDFLVLLQHPAVDAVIVETLQQLVGQEVQRLDRPKSRPSCLLIGSLALTVAAAIAGIVVLVLYLQGFLF